MTKKLWWIWAVGIFLAGVGMAVVKAHAWGYEGRELADSVRIQEFAAKDGTYCIVSYIPGRTIAMQCRYDNSKIYRQGPA